MSKRGQISISVVMGIVIIIIIGMLIVLYQQGYFSRTLESTQLKSESDQVNLYFKDCFEKSFLNILYIVGIQGGHVIFPIENIGTESGLKIGYGYFEGKNVIPSNQRIALEMSDYLNFVMPNCIGNNTFLGLNVVNTSRAIGRVDIFDDSVRGRMHYPLEIKKGDKTATIDEIYEISYPIRLGSVLNVANGVVQYELNDPNFLDLTYLDNTDMNVTIYNIDEKTNFYVINDPKSFYDGKPYIFQFLNELSFKKETSERK